MPIALKRVYVKPSPEDGVRILVERLWPRGIAKATAGIDHWFKQLAPSPELRKWYDHKPERWDEFRARYSAELADADTELLGQLVSLCSKDQVTFIFAARDEQRNSAVVLKDHVRELIAARAASG